MIVHSYVCSGSPGLGQTHLPEPGLFPLADTSDINSRRGTQKTIQPAILAVVHSPGNAISCSQHGNLTLNQTRNEAPPSFSGKNVS